jgi:hypothetical protein
MAIYVNTTERLTHEDVAKRLASIGQPKLATAVRRLGQDADDQASRYASLLSEYTRIVNSMAGPRPSPGQPVSYKPSPMSDG